MDKTAIKAIANPPPAGPRPDIRLPWPERSRAAWNRFWFTPTDPLALHVIRVLAGLLFLYWLLPLAGHVDGLFGMRGWFDQEAWREASRFAGGERVYRGLSFLFLAGSDASLQSMYWGSILVLLMFTLGVATRLTGVLTWVIVISFKANPAIRFDADELLAVLAFYLMVGYLLQGQLTRPLSPAARLFGPEDNWLLAPWLGRGSPAAQPPSHAANLVLRLIQVHFALIMLASGLHKLQMGDWWSGVALWYPLHPPFETTPAMIEAIKPMADVYLFFMSLGTYLFLAWQLTFPFWAWRASFRWLLWGGVLVGWLGLAFIYGLPYFGPFFAIASLTFVKAEEWQRLLGIISAARKRGTKQTLAPARLPVA